MRRSILGLTLALALCVPTLGAAQDFESLPSADPLDLSAIDIGIGVRAGDTMAIASYRADQMATVTGTFPHAVLRMKSYDEAAQAFGEYITYQAPATLDARTPVDFTASNVAAGRLSRRVDDLVNEVDTWTADAGADAFQSKTIVVDFWRWRKDWWARWDGNLEAESNKVGQGAYGFYRKEMVDDLLNDIEIAAQTHKPRYMIIGDELERVLATETSGGIAPAELSNFMAFYQDAIARVRSVSPETKVGVGFQWDRFVNRVAPLYAKAEGADQQETIDRAFEAVILPFIERSDIVALSSYATPNTDRTYYQYLRLLESRWGVTAPVVYYSVGTPVQSVVAYQEQQTYMEQFRNWNAGVNVEFVAWTSMLNLDGTDTNDQQPTGRCAAFIGPERTFEVDVSFCYDGLYTSIFSKKPILEFFESL